MSDAPKSITFQTRRKFFDRYADDDISGKLPSLVKYKRRFTCPCCGYPTLRSRGSYEICFICSWGDGSEDEQNADERSMQNHGFTLAAARSNFSLYGVMYAPGRDPRITGGDSPEEQAAKARVCAAFEAMLATPTHEHEALWQTVINAERELHRLLKIAIYDYQQKHRR